MRVVVAIWLTLFATVSFANDDLMTPMAGVRTAPPIELPDSNGQPFSMKEYEGKYTIIKIPVVSEVVYGRKTGYKIRNVKLSKKIESISATKIRKNLFNNEK